MVDEILFLPLDKFIDIHREYISLGDQKEETCGLYALTYILRGLGYRYHRDIPIDEDYLAYLARTRISPEEEQLRREVFTKLLHGSISLKEAMEKYGKILYRYELKTTTNPIELGTSAEGVKYALETASDGELRGVPIPSRRKDTIYFTEERFLRLVKLLIERIHEWRYQAILNVQTSKFINMISPYHDLFVVLFSEKPEAAIGYSPWSAGHFVSLAGFVKVKKEGSEKIYFLIRDSYKNAGYRGYHLQPLERVREALVRDDGREGGVLLIVRKDIVEEVEREIKELGLVIDLWDNGTPF